MKYTTLFPQLKGKNQASIEFIDAYESIDNPLFLDFMKIIVDNQSEFKGFRLCIDNFMSEMIAKIGGTDPKELYKLLNGIHETNSTRLGLSSGKPRGNSLGEELVQKLTKSLSFLKAIMLKGNLDIDSIFLAVEGISSDRISDMVTSVVKLELIKFTQKQCSLHKIPLTKKVKHRYFDINDKIWKTDTFELPSYNNSDIIFVPKRFISTYSGLSGTIGKFITLSFHAYYKTDSETIKAITKNKEFKGEIKRNEFDSWCSKSGFSARILAKKIFTDVPNKIIIRILADLRRKVSSLNDSKITDLLDENYQRIFARKHKK